MLKAWHYKRALIRIAQFSVDCLFYTRSILKRGVESTTWPLGQGEGEGAGGGCAHSPAKLEAFTLWMI